MSEHIARSFEEMGARTRITMIAPARARQWNQTRREAFFASLVPAMRIDVQRDGDGEYFDIQQRWDSTLAVLDVQAGERHLLLLSREPRWGGSGSTESKFLCGHDERAWFVAAIPETSKAPDVQGAMDALKPPKVWDAMYEFGVRREDRNLRRTGAFVRQGEWFFIPRHGIKPSEKQVLRYEPIRRGAGKPHVCEYLYREGGYSVHVCDKFPNGLTNAELHRLPRHIRKAHKWSLMYRDATAYVRGSVTHPDHDTIWLYPWHEVVMNTETQARAMQHVAFLD
jgi:hypothetical protein